jgi:hypothetical protein
MEDGIHGQKLRRHLGVVAIIGREAGSHRCRGSLVRLGANRHQPNGTGRDNLGRARFAQCEVVAQGSRDLDARRTGCRQVPPKRRLPGALPLVDDLFAFVATNPAPTLVRAFVALLQLLLIHPFKDGNGRCARGLFAAICARGGYQHPVVLLALQRLYGGSATRLHAGSAVLRATGDWRNYLAYCSQSLDEAIRNWSANQSTKTLHDRDHTAALASR